ncbi:MAG: low molecular weight protein arginine phosphatase [Gemmatimonadota bacterium]
MLDNEPTHGAPTGPDSPSSPAESGSIPTGDEGQPFRILFVCTGNTCRSPLAEVITRKRVAQRGWSGVEVRSAGVSAAAGSPASPGSVKAAAAHGLDLSGHRSAGLDEGQVARADLVLTMSAAHSDVVAAVGGGRRVAVITAFAEGEDDGAARSVPDPFGGDDAAYEAAYQELSRLVELVLDRLAPMVSP